jgi:hypothetical protein|nr:MAG TPA: hypothetical protein [Caudoviricetes sp.]DAX88111.1 MAG TPA: hypothetical protein [Caudoviricetes sp.]
MNARKHKRKIYTSIYYRYWWKWLKITFISETQYGSCVDEFAEMVIDEIGKESRDEIKKILIDEINNHE